MGGAGERKSRRDLWQGAVARLLFPRQTGIGPRFSFFKGSWSQSYKQKVLPEAGALLGGSGARIGVLLVNM